MNKNTSPTKTILLAEDDEDDFILFREALGENNKAIHLNWVRDGEELMDVLKMDAAALPDMVFLDINMPRKNGFECLTEIRQHPRFKHLPIIIFSTSNDPAFVSWMYNAGANLYVNKPTEFKKLKETLQKAISMDWETHCPHATINEFVLR